VMPLLYFINLHGPHLNGWYKYGWYKLRVDFDHLKIPLSQEKKGSKKET
jgi:hypothetical protein